MSKENYTAVYWLISVLVDQQLTMYNFNEELCRQLSNGDIVCKYDNGNLEMLRALLKKCAPDDTRTVFGECNFYWCIGKDFWYSSFETTKPTVPLSDFIVKDSENENPFVWDDALVSDFFTMCITKGITSANQALEQFKASKQRKPLFTTEDGKQIFKGDVYWFVVINNNFDITSTIACGSERQIDQCKDFSTEAAAREYVRLNKPMYSLNDVKKAMKSTHISTWTDNIITELEKIKP